MENQKLIPNQKLFSTGKTVKVFLVILGAIVFVLIVEAGYYLYISNQKKKPRTLSKPSPTPSLAKIQEEKPEIEFPGLIIPEEPKRYFEGLDYYEEIDGEKKLLVIEGIVDKIDFEKKIVTLRRKESTKDVQYISSDIVRVADAEDFLNDKEGSFSDIELDDFVSYNPSGENRENATWIVQK